MLTLTGSPAFQGAERVPARDVSHLIHDLIDFTGAPERILAQGIAMPESQFNRLAKGKTGLVKPQTLTPLKRIALLLDEADKSLAKTGVKKWLLSPHPALHDVPPILCLRTDRELEKVLSLLAAIRYGFPA